MIGYIIQAPIKATGVQRSEPKAIGILELAGIFMLLKNGVSSVPDIQTLQGGKHTSHISMATWQLSRTTRGESSLIIHSFRWGNTSGVAIPPRASAASWRTMSDSWSFRRTSKSDGTECGERSCPNMNAISCLRKETPMTSIQKNA